ncbi:AAA family ATPase [Mongoliitalea lutea]|uniref:Transporter n=1 Tax=Mongoliitalea lutea TaxID=849756 RepID=A0A8J3CZK1_9BACT|nr:ATP-binding protein [Mongoliitalea lutea]GHB52886.1 transporter [Mongoliitalea lutea]
MIIRFVLDNIFSFGERKEFNTLPNTRLKTLESHTYGLGDIELLKLSALYGANGAGKSNLFKAIYLLQRLVLDQKIPFGLRESRFKFIENPNTPQLLAVEFVQEEKAYYYGIEFIGERIATEELYLSGLGKKCDTLIFERKTDSSKVTAMHFSPEFEHDEKSQLLKSVLLEDFVKPDEPVFKLLSNRDNKFLGDVKKAFQWFSDTLQIITPDSKPRALAHRIDIDKEFKSYAEDMMCSFNLGIQSLSTDKIRVEDFFGKDNENELNELVKKVEESPNKMFGLRSRRGDEIVLVKENGDIWVKILKISHMGKNDQVAKFDLDEESDGTVRLLDFVPAFRTVVSEPKVFLVDEIERSIHPLLIKELVRKFSHDPQTKGQLIFTTHESNLLDQELFRQDEIWFAEKNRDGVTDLYSLSDFKEHKTIDIRKGYLNGRYGSIPFLGNLKDLNWHDYVTEQEPTL